MRRAQVRQRRTLNDGTRIYSVVCPFCNERHWTRGPVAECPVRPGHQFEIAHNDKTTR
jgi:hypothetical protein